MVFSFWLFTGLLLSSSLCNSQCILLEGSITVNVIRGMTLEMKITPPTYTAEVTFTGNFGEWIGFGFNKTVMYEAYTLVVDGDGQTTDTVYEYELAARTRGTELTKTINVLSNTVTDLVRTVVLTRNIAGNGESYYDFPTEPTSIPIIWAHGPIGQPTYSESTYMGGYGSSTITLTCVD
eukprot:545333_1